MHLISICIIILWGYAYPGISRMLDESSVVKAHQQWMMKYGITYTNSSEMEKRLQIFKENLYYIEKFNSAGNKSYTLGLNPYSDLTTEEFMGSYTGLNVPSHVSSSKTRSNQVLFNITDDVPTYLDWREDGAVTDIKAQGECGGCWAFAAVAAVESLWKISMGSLFRLSEQQVIDCDNESEGCDGGSIVNAYEYMIGSPGIVEESQYQYTQGQQSCKPIDIDDTEAYISSYSMVKEDDEQQLLQAVAKQPVAAGVHVGYEFKAYDGGIYAGTCGPTDNHAVLIVGYGVSENRDKYWLIKNSWGQGWGEKGYMRLIREGEAAGPEGHCSIANYASFPNL